MGKRLISATIAMIIGIGILFFDNKWVYIVAITAFSLMGVYELLGATKYLKTLPVSIISFFFVAISPLMYAYEPTRQYISMMCFALVASLFLIMLFVHQKVDFSEVCVVSAVSICIPLSMTCLWLMRDYYGDHGLFCIVYTLTITFMNDAGAFFTGLSIGKHKLAPQISPKKTWEGFYGGIATAALTSIVFAYAYEFIYNNYMATGDTVHTIKPLFIVYGVGIALFGVLGDLSASIVKRSCAVKDFGNIMPGHGGFLDRFDSVLFTAPLVYNMFTVWFPLEFIK
jgi:phosphatidate cytidylyltransferase